LHWQESSFQGENKLETYCRIRDRLTWFWVILQRTLAYHDKPKQFTLGILLVLMAAIGWAIYAIYQKELAQTYSTNQLNLFIYGFCTVLFAPFVHYGSFASLNLGSWMLVLFLGLNTLVAYGAIALAFRYLEANKVSVIIT